MNQAVAAEAWENKQGHDGLPYPDRGLTHPLEPAGEPWSEAGNDLERRFPKLWKKFSVPPPRLIRIVAAPPGEAPPAIRAAWVGCVIPLLEGKDGPEPSIRVTGVTSGQSVERGPVYKVRATDAISALEQHNAEAARWWKEHAPHVLQPGKLLAFSVDVCALLPLPKS